MRQGFWLAGALALIAWACASAAEEPVLGGPCEGCELVFEGMPQDLQARARIAPEGERGEPLIIEGTVRTAAGEPAPGIVVYAYHTGRDGTYPEGATRHGRLRGWARTGPDGRYRFDTIRPGAYPSRSDPQHVHMHVIEPGKGTYYIDEIVFEDDPRLTQEQLGRKPRGRGGPGLTHPVRDGEGIWRVRRDIVLGEGIPGYE